MLKLFNNNFNQKKIIPNPIHLLLLQHCNSGCLLKGAFDIIGRGGTFQKIINRRILKDEFFRGERGFHSTHTDYRKPTSKKLREMELGIDGKIDPKQFEGLEEIYNTSYKNTIDFLMEDATMNQELGRIDKKEAISKFSHEELQRYFVYNNLYEKLIEKGDTRCKYCWMHFDHCLCGRLRPFTFTPHWEKTVESQTIGVKNIELNLHLHFLMHRKEFHKSTNSCKILLHSDRTQTTHMYIEQHDMHEQAIKSLIEMTNHPSSNQFAYVLYPSDDSERIGDTLPKELDSFYSNLNEAVKERLSEVNDFHIHIFVIDGTWNDARMLNRKDYFGNLKRIRVDLPEDYKYVFKLVRTGKVMGRISTIEAVMLLLREFNSISTCEFLLEKSNMTLKASEIGKDFETSIESVYENLETMMEVSGVKYRRHGLKQKLESKYGTTEDLD